MCGVTGIPAMVLAFNEAHINELQVLFAYVKDAESFDLLKIS